MHEVLRAAGDPADVALSAGGARGARARSRPSQLTCYLLPRGRLRWAKKASPQRDPS